LQVTDLPGYGFADISLSEQEKWRKMISKYLEQREQLRGIVVLVDIRHPADDKDILMLELLRLRNIPHCVVATKADKIPKTKIPRTLQILAKGLGLREESLFAVSSLKNTGFDPLLSWIYDRLN
ncbi:MAG: GTP-binding protein, partial [Candidatus Cloacimonadaceae bacterium]|nr:GTP-binding protein [Candidatus Cloacimonadaceae bacterium]